MDSILQLCFLHRVLYSKLDNVFRGSKEEGAAQGRFIAFCKEMVELKRLTEDYLEIMRYYKLYLWSIGHLAMASSGVALAIGVESGMDSFVRVMLYPIYTLSLMTMWGILGTYFEDSVREGAMAAIHWFLYVSFIGPRVELDPVQRRLDGDACVCEEDGDHPDEFWAGHA